MGKYGLLYLVLLLFIASGCDIINPAEDIPSYIHIDKITLETTSIQGTNSNKIWDAWVYVDGNEAGVYELPVTFPVLATGKHSILIRAGIKHNGVSSDRVIYPFYKKYEIDLDLKPKQVDTIAPKTFYLDELNFSDLWLADFEDAGLPLDTVPSSDVKLEQVLDSITNSKVGQFIITTDNPTFYCISDPIYLPVNGTVTYLELNYRCNYQFAFGLIANTGTTTSSQQVFLFNSTSGNWNKTYIELTAYAVDNPLAYSFSLYFAASLTDEDFSQAEVALDNLKVIHL